MSQLYVILSIIGWLWASIVAIFSQVPRRFAPETQDGSPSSTATGSSPQS